VAEVVRVASGAALPFKGRCGVTKLPKVLGSSGNDHRKYNQLVYDHLVLFILMCFGSYAQNWQSTLKSGVRSE
jgi:hypothetical protein